MTKHLILSSLVTLASLTGWAQKAEYFTPVAESALRAPSVPLFTSDPMFSYWSPYDTLNEGCVEHWHGQKKAMLAALRVDGKTYRVMGDDEVVLDPIAPMANVERWEARYTRRTPQGNWMAPEYNDADWRKGKAAFGSDGLNFISTPWRETDSDIYIRRVIDVPEGFENEDLYMVYSHDDSFELYINGNQVASTGETWVENVHLRLTPEMKKMLHTGKNVIAAHCHNHTGGAYADYGLFKVNRDAVSLSTLAKQTSVSVMATSSYYTFECGPVELKLVFTAPQLIDDLDLLSTPVNYLSYQVRSLDKKNHDVQLFFATTPQLTVNEKSQATEATTFGKNGISYVKAGSINQPVTDRRGDGVCIDWGYAYLASVNGAGKSTSLCDYQQSKSTFDHTGKLPVSTTRIRTYNDKFPAMAYTHNLGTVGTTAKSDYVMLGYDDVYSVEYMFDRRKGYWAHDGAVTITDAFETFRNNYAAIMDRCRALDATIYGDALAAGGKKYAEICAASYRQVMAAHKLFTDKDGNLMWFSKENGSNGCINTVDLTYPSAPLFLVYNPDLEKAMMTSIFEYSKTGRWTKPFAAHDLGTYPKANGQVYGGDMPVEESGNMVILAAAIAKIEGNADYALRYWDIITTWTDYLVKYGLDPENQLCTDDFAGHWAHNANLSIKAIMGIAGYAEMAEMLGYHDVAKKYMAISRDYAQKWEKMADDGDHYRLAFDRPDTWSQKYNMVWDTLWATGLFSDQVAKKEIACYLKNQNKFGLPLDCRKAYTKSDWIMWTAAMSPDVPTFEKFVDPLYVYVNETPSRVPISDWHQTDSGHWVGFRARSVIGGYWMQVLRHQYGK